MSQEKYEKPDAHPPGEYVHYLKAKTFLERQFEATAGEIAMWVWAKAKFGGINGYADATLYQDPPLFSFDNFPADNHDYLSGLARCYFRQSDLDAFRPKDRFLTYQKLKQRWSTRYIESEADALIRGKAASGELDAYHHITGTTRGTPYGATMNQCAPLESGMFPLAQVEAIEESDFGESEPPDDAQLLGASPGLDVLAISATELEARPSAVANAAGQILPLAAAREGSNIGPDQDTPSNLCEVFRSMQNLTADEVSIAFVGDKTENGVEANNMLEISARGATARVPFAALGLVDRRSGSVNSQGVTLLGLAARKKPIYTPAIAKVISRLREMLRTHLGIRSDPFDPYRKGAGWGPRFTINDKRGAADERAKREAERSMVSLDPLNEHHNDPVGAITTRISALADGDRLGDTNQADQSFDEEDDEAGDYLRNRKGQ